MWFLPEVTLLLLPAIALIVGLVGSSVRWLIESALREPGAGAGFARPDPIRTISLDFATGTAVLCLLYVGATALSLHVTVWTLVGLMVFAAGVATYRWVRSGFRSIATIRDRIKAHWPALLALAAILAGSLATRLVPYEGLYVYAGVDIRTYTDITVLTAAKGQIPFGWGTFTLPSWNYTTNFHVIFAGSEAIFAGLGALLPIGLPQLDSAVTILYNIAIALAVFTLARTLFPDRSAWLGVAAAAVISFVAVYPMNFLQWGGIDDTIVWFLFPLALVPLLELMNGTRRLASTIILSGVLLGATIVISPLGAVYVATFTFSFVVESVVRRARLRTFLTAVVSSWAIALAFDSLPIWAAIRTSLQVGAHNGGGPGVLTPSFSYAAIFQYGPLSESLTRLFEASTGSPVAAFVVVLGWIGIGWSLRWARGVPALALWIGTLLLLNENGPNGLYWIRYPLWYSVFPDRTAHLMLIPLSIGTALVLLRLGEYAFARPAPSVATRPTRLPQITLRQGFSVALVVGLVVSASAFSLVAYHNNTNTIHFGTAVTSEDLDGFNWLKAHVPSGATVLVSEVDSGSWIPAFTGLRVFPNPQITNNQSIVSDYTAMVAGLQRDNYTEYLSLVSEFGISYAYWGSRVAYGTPFPFGPTTLTQVPSIAPWVYAEYSCLPGPSNTSVSLRCDNDSVTLVGPLAFEMTTYHNGTIVGYANYSLAAGELWTYVLQSHTSSHPGTWAARFVALNLGTKEFHEGGVAIVAINSCWVAAGPACSLPPT